MLAIKSQVGESASKKRKTMADDPKEPSEAEQACLDDHGTPFFQRIDTYVFCPNRTRL